MVYIAYYRDSNLTTILLGVYSTREKADAAIASILECGGNAWVRSYVLDTTASY